MTLDELKFDAAGLVTVVVQARFGGEVRMVAHADREAIMKTLETGEAHFFSRSRQRLWRKGETSGNTISVAEVFRDCDGDALIYLGETRGPSCHTGEESCFFQRIDGRAEADHPAGAPAPTPPNRATPTLERLAATLEARRDATSGKSYTKSLLDGGPRKIAGKVREEADELATALTDESDDRVVSESADVIYHLMVGLTARGLTLRDVERELARRAGTSGHAEKAAR